MKATGESFIQSVCKSFEDYAKNADFVDYVEERKTVDKKLGRIFTVNKNLEIDSIFLMMFDERETVGLGVTVEILAKSSEAERRKEIAWYTDSDVSELCPSRNSSPMFDKNRGCIFIGRIAT